MTILLMISYYLRQHLEQRLKDLRGLAIESLFMIIGQLAVNFRPKIHKQRAFPFLLIQHNLFHNTGQHL